MFVIRIKEGNQKGKFLTKDDIKTYGGRKYYWNENIKHASNIQKSRIFRQINHIKTSKIYRYKHSILYGSMVKEYSFDELFEIVEVELKIKENNEDPRNIR